MPDLRVEFEKLLSQYGSNVYLQRCLNPMNNDNEKPRYEKKLEKHTVRIMNVLASRFLAGVSQESPEGLEYPTEMVFWFKWDVNPMVGDRVYENIPRYPNNQVLYELDYADPKRGLSGRIEFWACGATRKPVPPQDDTVTPRATPAVPLEELT